VRNGRGGGIETGSGGVVAVSTRWRLAWEVGTCWPGGEGLQTRGVRVILALSFDSVKVRNQVLHAFLGEGRRSLGLGLGFIS